MSLNKMICGRGMQYFIAAIVITFDILYFFYFNKENLVDNHQYNQVENMLIGQICITLISVLSLILSYGNRQLLYTTIIINAGLMAISIYTLTILSDLPDQKNHLEIVIFAYFANIVGAIGGFISIASCLLMLNNRC